MTPASRLWTCIYSSGYEQGVTLPGGMGGHKQEERVGHEGGKPFLLRGT